MQLPWSKMRHQVNHTLATKIGAACLGIFLNLVSKSAARCKRLSDPFLSHGTPWLRCLLQRSPHPVWFCSTHVDRRPLSNGAVVTPAKKTKTDLLSTKQDAHMHNSERPSPRIPDLLRCKNENNIHPHTKKSKRKKSHQSKDWTTQTKTRRNYRSYIQKTMRSPRVLPYFVPIMSAFSRSQMSTSASEKLAKAISVFRLGWQGWCLYMTQDAQRPPQKKLCKTPF